jgi:hypothetical protein
VPPFPPPTEPPVAVLVPFFAPEPDIDPAPPPAASKSVVALLATLEKPPAVGVALAVPFAPAVIVSVSPDVTDKLL